MSIDSYDLDKLRYLLRQLSKENERLKEILRKADIPFESQNVFEEKNFEENYDEDQPGRIIEKAIDRELARQFYKMFWGRTDVFARRSKKVLIIRNVIIALLIFVQLTLVRKNFVRQSVHIGSGKRWNLGLSFAI